MPSATASGFPFPVGSDDMADTDLYIKALADFLEGRIGDTYCELAAAAATSIPQTGVLTKINLATTVHNNAALFTVAASVITIVGAGRYDISAKAGLSDAASTAGHRGIAIIKNGSGQPLGRSTAVNVAGIHATPCLLGEPLSAGDTIQLQGYQTSAAAINTVHSGIEVSRLYIRKVGS